MPLSTPSPESARLRDIAGYSILDSLPEAEYNEITKLASYICGTPVSMLTIIDEKRQWTKANFGIEMPDIPREYAFCSTAIDSSEELFIVPDLRRDARFSENPFVTGDASAVFYAGVPLISPQGFALGTLCVLDTKPGSLNTAQAEALKALAHQVISLLELRKNKKMLESAMTGLEEKNTELEKFAYIVAHDIKSPLNNICGFSQYLIKAHSAGLNEEAKEVISSIAESSDRLKGLVEGILDYSRTQQLAPADTSGVDMAALLTETVDMFSFNSDCRFTITCDVHCIPASRTVMSQILINLISNAIKYNDKKDPLIDIGFTREGAIYVLTVSDNGAGIAAEDQVEIFDIFKVLPGEDRFGKKGNGIGLATVKKLVEKLGGNIQLDSTLKVGSNFTVSIPA